VGLSRLVNRNDVRMVNGRRGPGLAGEAQPEFLVRTQRGRHDLQRYLPTEPFVARKVYRSHAAGPDTALDPVPRDTRGISSDKSHIDSHRNPPQYQAFWFMSPFAAVRDITRIGAILAR